MRLLVMRHGATRANDEHRYAGCRTDEPLSERGRAQCARAGANEEVSVVYASFLERARQTAQLCFPNARVQVVAGLEEFDFGAFEGRTADEMEHDAAYRAWVDSGCRAPCPGGDALEDYRARARAALLGVLRAAERAGEELVVVVGHGGTVMAAVDGFFGGGVPNCEGYVAEVRVGEHDFELLHPTRFRTFADAFA